MRIVNICLNKIKCESKVLYFMYTEKDLIKIAKRENNTKRNYLVVNPLQGKHIPVKPGRALALFSALSEVLRDKYNKEKLLFIGFAETATAIGVQVAIDFKALYIQTTRENLKNVKYLFFSEEHSHATEQKLVKNDIGNIIKNIDRIIFIEDEVTTGKTILNIIKVLKNEYGTELKFAVASLINGMTGKYQDIYNKENIGLHYIIKTDNSKYINTAGLFAGDGIYIPCCTNKAVYNVFKASGFMDTRRLTDASKYKEACENLWKQVYAFIGDKSNKNILVAGTEEFMYPAIFIGNKLEQMDNNVKTHSTTRSPVTVSMEEDYPLHERYELKSLYDKDRVTYIYGIDFYDEVIIITDSDISSKEGINSLINALKHKNKNILLVRWCLNEEFI